MPNLKKIDKVTVGAGGTSSITFSNIPQTYTDLKVLISARNTSTSGNESQIILTINGDGSAGSWNLIYGNSSAAISGAGSGYLQPAHAPSANTTANTFSNAEIYFPNYTSTSTYKSFSSDFVTENNLGTANAAILGIYANLWSNTNAITSLTLTSNVSNFVQYSSATLYGISSVTTGSKATGGIVYSDSTHYYHVFPYSGTFTPTQSLTADYLVVAGGGGSTGDRGGGGGAGGVRCTVGATGGGGSLESPLSLTAQAYTVTVGAGAAGRAVGSNSVFSTITSSGGGGGGRVSATTGQNGGSGGGGDGETSAVGGSGTANQGYAGGNGAATGAGGGGGAGAVGGAGVGPEGSGFGGAGGIGILTTMPSGVSTYYGGGGGGYGNLGGPGGLGGGGEGSDGSIGLNATNGTANTGGGAGGTHGSSTSTNGGSGIVIIRYAI
jgi:hypothetical protein